MASHSRSRIAAPTATLVAFIALVSSAQADPLSLADGVISISKEYLYQQTEDTTPITPYESAFWAEVIGVANVASATVQATAAAPLSSAQSMDIDLDDPDFSYEAHYTTDVSNNLGSNYPNSAIYTISTTLANTTVVNNTIAGPGAGTFLNYLPVAPTINLTNALSGGSWNGGVYSFDAASHDTFTLTLSGAAFSVGTVGNYKSSSVDVFLGDGTRVAEFNTAITPAGENLADIVLTFNLTGAPDEHDDDTIVNFTTGASIYLEVGYQNILADAATGLGDTTVKAFIEASYTGINLYAAPIPEPSTYAAILGGVSLLGAAFWRHRNRA